MATEVILSLPDEVYRRAVRLARMTNRDVSRVLAETIESALPPPDTSAVNPPPIREVPERESPAAAKSGMNEAQGKRLDQLLDRQRAGKLNDAERGELASLMQLYHESLVRKAQALSGAARQPRRAAPAR